jgi:hypothetical protein
MKTQTATEIKERPILFSSPMVKAILEGRKTQTRRVMKPQPGITTSSYWDLYENGSRFKPIRRIPDYEGEIGGESHAKAIEFMDSESNETRSCPYGKAGDRLYVRETWQTVFEAYNGQRYTEAKPFRHYKNSWIEYAATPRDEQSPHRWKPSIHMPRKYSRITLEITNIRVEKLQDISHRDALAEGVSYDVSQENGPPLARFQSLWKEINGAESWNQNVWVWVIEFKKI